MSYSKAVSVRGRAKSECRSQRSSIAFRTLRHLGLQELQLKRTAIYVQVHTQAARRGANVKFNFVFK